MIDPAQLYPAVFNPHIGTDFIVSDGERTVALRLVNVVDGGIANGLHQFSLIFHGPADRLLEERIHAMAHGALGTLEIFIVPIHGSDAVRTIYEACFSTRAEKVSTSSK
jgi:hypothetical protein